mmetsp:Transcript_5555/g.6243  ORF Transcript_5555/g.6243 Transcript_5555/m.6243 type:complete len:188 (+) Transcript_5555:50-613(+)
MASSSPSPSSSFNLFTRKNDASINNASLLSLSSSSSASSASRSRFVSFDGQQSLSAFQKSPAATTTSSQNHLWSVIEEHPPSPGPDLSTIQYDHDDHDDDDTNKLYYSVYDNDDDDDDDMIMGEDEYDEYEANEDYHEDDDDDNTMMIDYHMTYTESDDEARFCQVTTDADTRTRSRPMNKAGKYRK